jgi:CRP/FNR family transcriptional regulator
MRAVTFVTLETAFVWKARFGTLDGVDTVEALKRTTLFGELDAPDLAALAVRAVERHLKRGEILFLAGEPAGGLYVVIEGSIRAYRVGADGREQTLHVERAGATLAEVPVFDEGRYPSTTVAEEDSIILFIERRDVLALCLERPCVSLAALKVLAGRLRTCAALVESLSLRDVDRRLAALLHEEASDHSRRSGSSLIFELALTHQQMAARIGSVREVVSRALSRLEQSGLIQMEGRRITIPDGNALRDYPAK